MPIVNNDAMNLQTIKRLVPQFGETLAQGVLTAKYKHLFKKDEIHFYMHKNEKFCIGADLTGYVMFVLKFNDFKVDNFKSVSLVGIHPAFLRSGYVKFFYYSYVKQYGGIASDFSQRKDGMELWKKLVLESSKNGCSAYVYNNLNGDKKKYTGKNIADSKIWATSAHENLAIVLTK